VSSGTFGTCVCRCSPLVAAQGEKEEDVNLSV
jgi:hypothetical protein